MSTDNNSQNGSHISLSELDAIIQQAENGYLQIDFVGLLKTIRPALAGSTPCGGGVAPDLAQKLRNYAYSLEHGFGTLKIIEELRKDAAALCSELPRESHSSAITMKRAYHESIEQLEQEGFTVIPTLISSYVVQLEAELRTLRGSASTGVGEAPDWIRAEDLPELLSILKSKMPESEQIVYENELITTLHQRALVRGGYGLSEVQVRELVRAFRRLATTPPATPLQVAREQKGGQEHV